MEAKEIAKLVLKAMEIHEASYVPPSTLAGHYAKSKEQAVREACEGQFKSYVAEAWIGLLDLLLVDPLWNDAEAWARRTVKLEHGR